MSDSSGDPMPRPTKGTHQPPSPHAFAGVLHARGAATTEYTVLVGFVAIACIGSFIFLGVAFVSNFEARRDLILYPSP